jgi:tripartite-type tricarboxylate transporter receptor subunit TctC
MHAVTTVITLTIAAALPLAAQAQNWPAKPIRMLIPYPAGGTSDILARMIGPKLTEAWGPQIVVDNRVGANGNIAMDLTARSPADGYSSVLTDLGNLVISPSMYSKLPFDIQRDLTPIAMVSYSAHLLTVHPSVPVKTVKELITLAKASPGKLNYPAGLGSAVHLAGLSLEQRTGAKWVYVPTKGGQASIMTLATGEGDLLFMGMLQTLPHVKAGRLKLIAVSSEKRDPNLPNVPTVIESGIPDFEVTVWQGYAMPKGVSPAHLKSVHTAMMKALAVPDLKTRFFDNGVSAAPQTPEEFGNFVRKEHARWGKAIAVSNIKVE